MSARAEPNIAGKPLAADRLSQLALATRYAVSLTITRLNGSLKTEYRAEVRQEHRAIVEAVLARDADAARAAAAEHMRQATRRLQDADAPIHQQLKGRSA